MNVTFPLECRMSVSRTSSTRFVLEGTMSKIRAAVPFVLALTLLPSNAAARQQTAEDSDTTQAPVIGRGSRGVFIESADGNWRTSLQFRLQFRVSHPYDPDPDEDIDFAAPSATQTEVRRARFKVDGHGFTPWLRYYMEYELANSRLLNWEVKVEPSTKLRFKVGQWKANYSRERIVSSGRQLMADRSLINRPFTIDRQQGVSLYGRLGEGSLADVNYWVSAFTGLGRGGRRNDDNQLMYMGRLQWNPFGRVVDFRGGDLARREDPALSIAIAGVTNNSPCTRFSGSGCGALVGYTADTEYRVNQATFETAFMWQGFSWAQEFHWKSIQNVETSEETELLGNYAMIGYFPGEVIESIPDPLEVGFRWSVFEPDESVNDADWSELTFAVNWLFSGHDNKVTAEYALFTVKDATDSESGGRWRLQWDIQF
jgi:phosphate-selective porin